jgi:hypothetical protein
VLVHERGGLNVLAFAQQTHDLGVGAAITRAARLCGIGRARGAAAPEPAFELGDPQLERLDLLSGPFVDGCSVSLRAPRVQLAARGIGSR